MGNIPWFGALVVLASTGVLWGCYGNTTHSHDESGGTGGTGGTGGSSAAGGSKSGTGGAQGGGGSNGSGGASNWPPPLPTTAPTAVDLLFVIDNSISMTDKQELLSQAVPQLVRRLITPDCLDASGAVLGASDSLGNCAAGTPEFPAVSNLHLGIITSSLGSHGGQICSDVAGNPRLDDHAHLIGTVVGLPSWNNTGFLAWDPTGAANTPPGEASADTLISSFQNHVEGAGEEGCGYEAQLEAWYRFLVDPDPPQSVVQSGGVSTPQGTDAVVLAEREAFLRPDSLLAIVVLSDENDCSIIDQGQGWLVGLQQNGGNPFQMPRATSACQTDPNSECCRTCASSEPNGPPPGCTSLQADASCAQG
ncbi:MAG TPA: hypothetical protein VGP93_19430, partial [Polyangiaceae bacterium]|nr:hypothetical protein [Polyangiaceae bacterium]